MLETVEGVITRIVKYGESSLILDLLCPDDGIRSYIVGGIRKKGKRDKSALVRPVNLVKAEVYSKDGGKLSRVKEISYNYIYKDIPFDVAKSTIALFLVEVCRKAVKASDDAKGIYNYIVKGLIHLDNLTVGLVHFHITFLIGLAKHLGFEMQSRSSSEAPYFDLRVGSFVEERTDHRLVCDEELSDHLHLYLSGGEQPAVDRKGRKRVIQSLVDYYSYHIDGFGELKSLDVLMSLYR